MTERLSRPGEAEAAEWFEKKIDTVPTEFRAILKGYSGVPADAVIPHVQKIRDSGFKTWPYPCIGQGRFLDMNIAKHPFYSEVQSRLKTGQTLLDAGCCFGQDIRKLVFDGAPDSSKLHGLDLEQPFFELGYEMFCDKAKLEAKFFAVDLLKPATEMEELDGKIDIISAFSLLHLFLREDQATAGSRLVGFSKPVAGSTIIGRQIGTSKPAVYKALGEDMMVYFHDVETFGKMWKDIGTATGTEWELDAFDQPVEAKLASQSWAMPGMSWIYFRLTRK